MKAEIQRKLENFLTTVFKIMRKLLILFFCITLFSCNKDDDLRNSNPNTSSIKNTSCNIISEIYSVGADSLKDKGITRYYYKNNRLVKKKKVSYDHGIADSTLYYYNSSNKLSYVLENALYPTRLDTAFFIEYNNAGEIYKITRPTLLADTLKFKQVYTLGYTNSKLSSIYHERFISSKYSTFSSLSLDSRGNITLIRTDSVNGLKNEDDNYVTIVYDLKKNPFYNSFDDEFQLLRSLSPNNILSSFAYRKDTLQRMHNTEYIYNNLDYPLTISDIRQFNETHKYTYKYECY